ncbi:MAG TPA: tetratricopeptide repeat protein [Acidobacteriaceae bacterium]|nr:tetratricopeptide repeat protein [Acidobacteriaceae bacterium]
MQRCFALTARLTAAALFAVPAFSCACAENTEPAQSPPQLTARPIPVSAPQVAAVDLSPEIRGDLAMAHEQYLQAIDAYSQVPEKNAVIWNKLGMAYHHLFAIDEARRDYQRALRLRPDYPEAMNNMGAVYYATKNYKKAIRYYEKAIRFEPNSAPIYSNLGTAWFARGKVERGVEAYRTAFALDPMVFESNSSLLVNEALPAHDRALQDYCLAKLFAASGKKEEAIEFLRKALDEGFSDRRKILEDQTLASLRATPEFAELMNEQKLR